MRRLAHSLYGKIAATYLVLLLLFAVLSVLFSVRSTIRYTQESDQKLNLPLAEEFARRVTPLVGDTLDTDGLKHAFHDFMVVNPRVDIYLLDERGRILSSSVGADSLALEAVDVAPLRRLLEPEAVLPVLGADPRSTADRKIFSAAEMDAGATPHFVYVILQSKEYDSAAAMLRDNYMFRTGAVNLALAFLFTGLAGLLVFALLTRRFRAITRAVQDFKNGRLDRRVGSTSRDEVGALAATIDEMADSVQAHVESLQRRDDLRREFIANISHDLRSPLTSIQGYVETILLKNDALPRETRTRYLEIVLDETVLLGTLVDQLLELSKLDAGQVEPTAESFAASELVQDVVVKFHPRAEHLGVDLRAAPHTRDEPMVYGDIGMIERVVTNLVDNALRHTPSGGRVEVETAVQDGRVRVTISDTGVGIPAEELPHITERFYRGRAGRARTAGGTGLGLSIAKRILELHGSALAIESRVDVGTTIAFDLPTQANGWTG